MKTLTTLILAIVVTGVMTGCDTKAPIEKNYNCTVEQYVIDDRIFTAVWWQGNIVWSKYRNPTVLKDTLVKDSILAEIILKTCKSIK